MRWFTTVAIVCGVVMYFPLALYAQADLSISITPPLFQLAISPGETWRSAIKVVNNNAYDVPYYVQVVDFQAQGESGQSTFIPLIEGERELGATLASWVEIPQVPIVIPKGKSGEIPFTVKIPLDAPPGGHYAAILVGTQPGALDMSGPTMKIASFVSSLLFVKIKGTVEERGRIREFRSTEELYQEPKADFVLRFENIGTTHLRPQGEITLYNMWGKERGKVIINQKMGSFGSVLPNSTRKYQFSWEGEQDISDIGRYSATVTLTFGDEARQNMSAKTYFWIVPVVPVASVVGSIALGILLLVWFIRRYIRRALMIEAMRVDGSRTSVTRERTHALQTLVAPIREGVVDLRRIASTGAVSGDIGDATSVHTASEFLVKYRMFFLFLLVVTFSGVGLWSYMSRTLAPKSHFQISDVQIEEAPLLDMESTTK